MSKSKKTKNPEEISPEALIKDTEKIFSFIDKFESLDFGKKIPKKITKEIKKTDKILKEKYKNLDTEK